MKKTHRLQGKITNRLIIQWDSEVYKTIGEKIFVEREGFRCNSLEAAQKILDRRVGTKIQVAKFYDDKGIETVMKLPQKKTIKQQLTNA